MSGGLPVLLYSLLTMGTSIRARVTRNTVRGAQAHGSLDVYSPVGADGEAPVVVFAHSGRPAQASRKRHERIGQMFAARGLVTVIPDFQAAPKGDPSAPIADVAKAIAWARTHASSFGGDPERIVVVGHSGGAYVAAMLALESRWLADAGLGPADIRGMVGVCGLYDVPPAEGSPSRQPVGHARPDAPPMLLIAGGRDGGAPDRHTASLARALRTVGGQVAEIRYPGLADRLSLKSLASALRFGAAVLDEIERFIRLRGLERAAA